MPDPVADGGRVAATRDDSAAVRILGIDTSLRSTGLGVVAAQSSRFSMIDGATLKNAANLPLTACLLRIRNGVADMIRQSRPRAAAIEGAFFQKNARTAMILGHARGVALAACAEAGLPVYEYAPRKVKLAVAGFGGAEKAQVRKMLVALLGLDREPQEDVGDALAIALCHLHNRSGIAALAPTEL
jgi:crossover junction endodeoxyribonuclease RuvC